MQAWYKTATWLWLLAPVSVLFALVSGLRRWLFRRGSKAVYRAPVPVVVVGNLTVGGNGKTPLVVWLVEWLRRQGYTPGVISRGYGGKAEQYPLLLEANTGPGQAGDEPVLIHRRTGCPVVVGPKRGEAAALLASLGVDIIISDDGLQHYALARDIELVVVDGKRRFGNGHLLPMGPLREGLWRLDRVDAIINNGGPVYAGEYQMTLEPGALQAVGGTQATPEPGDRIHALAGIGHPPRFFTTLEQLGFILEQRLALADHKAVTPEQLTGLQSAPLLITEKDAVKWPGGHDNTWFVPVDARLPAEFEQLLLTRLKELDHGD
ncbi:tetraacyldisaccharide 4'-kinase [Oceanisphaera arctica]|uniref:Tetraacyldisaccharide 4'-kinase n=1 Tax=Oceanisphaera arctica TaxID=641510 RepID=A0A2P5TN26_9GAMM|nr:tetraacyldisaccharide 4'-kinase [Oceanisphaera arctica]PPL16885.1 tetraacyldisaccharide 4'-kinase [Oceanisphaera arctica]GHA19477.1 tetraacyldisaccharide 4'-kinase [Oceanisphaera arctica]